MFPKQVIVVVTNKNINIDLISPKDNVETCPFLSNKVSPSKVIPKWDNKEDLVEREGTMQTIMGIMG